jgi:hypothetical protein
MGICQTAPFRASALQLHYIVGYKKQIPDCFLQNEEIWNSWCNLSSMLVLFTIVDVFHLIVVPAFDMHSMRFSCPDERAAEYVGRLW